MKIKFISINHVTYKNSFFLGFFETW